MSQIFCFGDSITYGAEDEELSGWVTRLRLKIDKEHHFKDLVYNLGIPGETTDGLVKRFNKEAELRIREDREVENIFIFAYGANDSAFIKSKNSFRVDPDNFKKNLIKIITEAKNFGNKIYIQTVTPIVEESMIYHPNKDKARTNKWIEEYNSKIFELSKEYNIEIIDVNSAFLKQDYKYLFCKDGLHPNNNGHEIIFNITIDKII